MKVIEEKLNHCDKCECTTKHHRNNTKTGLIMILVHIVLTVFTMGLWLALLIFYKLVTAKIGGRKCSNCVEVGIMHRKLF